MLRSILCVSSMIAHYLAICGPKRWPHILGLLYLGSYPTRRIAEPPPWPFHIRPSAAPGASDRSRILLARGPLVPYEHSPYPTGNERQTGSDSAQVRTHTPERTRHTRAGRHIDCPTACGSQEASHPRQSLSSARTRLFEGPGWGPQLPCFSTDSSR